MNWKTIGVSLFFATAVLAGDEFKSASVLYDAGKYADAAAAFERITPKTAAVLFNLGNAHFRLEQLGRAVLDYERARQLAPTDPDILANLRFAEERLGVAEVNLPTKPGARFWESITGRRTIGQWARHEVAGVWLTVLLLAGAIWWPRLRTGLVIFAVVAGGWLVLTSAILVWRTTAPPAAIVLTGQTEARFAPLEDATVHFQLGEGTKVCIREDRGQWWLVDRADGQQGWIKSDAVERVLVRP
jgi:tetratricopeptide (TPR) repeat protein